MIKTAVSKATTDNLGLVRWSESRKVKCYRFVWSEQKGTMCS